MAQKNSRKGSEKGPSWLTLLVGQSNQPKSVMDDMTQPEREAFNKWLSEQPGDPERGGVINDMRWPGWAGVMERRARERSGKDPARKYGVRPVEVVQQMSDLTPEQLEAIAAKSVALRVPFLPERYSCTDVYEWLVKQSDTEPGALVRNWVGKMRTDDEALTQAARAQLLIETINEMATSLRSFATDAGMVDVAEQIIKLTED